MTVKTLLLLALAAIWSTPCVAQDKTKPDEGTTIQGKILQGTDHDSFQIDLTNLTVRFLQRVELPPPPVPENWAAMTQADRESWWAKFIESDKGKDFVAKRESILKSAGEFESKVDEDGKFVVYDVTPGTYGMTARFDKVIGPRTYAFEVFGEIPVSAEADVVELGERKLVITPIIRTGEPAGSWRTVESLGGDEVALENFKGKYLLINFWAADDPSKEFQKDIQAAYKILKEKHAFDLLSVALDQKKETLTEFLKANPLEGVLVHANRQDRIARVFGIHTTPGLLLVGPDGMIKMTYPEMIAAYESGKPSLDVILDDRITGKDAQETPESGGQ